MTAVTCPVRPETTRRSTGKAPIARLPIGPLVEQLQRRGVEWPLATIARTAQVTRETSYRWARHGIPEDAADLVVCRLFNDHPSSVWPEWWAISGLIGI